MKKTKKKASSHFVVVPNRDWKSTGKGASKTSTVVHRAAEATRKNRQYKLVKGNSGTYVVVTSKTSGQIISKFKVDHPNQLKRVRKFSLEPKRGTVSPEKIFKVI